MIFNEDQWSLSVPKEKQIDQRFMETERRDDKKFYKRIGNSKYVKYRKKGNK